MVVLYIIVAILTYITFTMIVVLLKFWRRLKEAELHIDTLRDITLYQLIANDESARKMYEAIRDTEDTFNAKTGKDA